MPGEIPSPRRRRIRSELRSLREEAGLTQREVAAAMGWSVSKLNRMERGEVRISPGDVMVLAQYYGVSDTDHVDELVSVARKAWPEQRFRNLLAPEFVDYLAYEAVASHIFMWNLTLIPGLLQTKRYMTAIFENVLELKGDTVDRLVAVRIKRQERLHSTNPPKVNALFDESVFHREVGGPEVMREQLESLRTMNERSNIAIRVVPFDLGAHPGLHQSFVLLEFAGAEHKRVVYLESSGGQSTIHDQPEVTRRYKKRFTKLAEKAYSEDLEGIIDPLLAKL